MPSPRQMLLELRSQKITYRMVAGLCGCSYQSIRFIACGKTVEPAYSTGRMIESLYDLYVPKEKAAASPGASGGGITATSAEISK